MSYEAIVELVKAADINVNIQREVAGNISDMKVESIALKTDMNNKLNTVNQNLQENRKTMESLMAAVSTLNTTMTEEGTKNRMVSMIGSARDRNIVRAKNWCFNESGAECSEILIKTIISNFLKGGGCYIGTFTTSNLGHYEDGHMKEKSKEAFRDKLKDEIMNITGTFPTIKLTDDRWAIFRGF